MSGTRCVFVIKETRHSQGSLTWLIITLSMDPWHLQPPPPYVKGDHTSQFFQDNLIT